MGKGVSQWQFAQSEVRIRQWQLRQSDVRVWRFRRQLSTQRFFHNRPGESQMEAVAIAGRSPIRKELSLLRQSGARPVCFRGIRRHKSIEWFLQTKHDNWGLCQNRSERPNPLSKVFPQLLGVWAENHYFRRVQWTSATQRFVWVWFRL